MTDQKKHKRRIRARMKETGENFTTAKSEVEVDTGAEDIKFVERMAGLDPDRFRLASTRLTSKSEKEICLLRFLLKMPQDVIAERLQISQPTVCYRLRRASKVLREEFRGQAQQAVVEDPLPELEIDLGEGTSKRASPEKTDSPLELLEEMGLQGIWEDAPDVWAVFDGRPQVARNRRGFVEPQEGQVIGRLNSTTTFAPVVSDAPDAFEQILGDMPKVRARLEPAGQALEALRAYHLGRALTIEPTIEADEIQEFRWAFSNFAIAIASPMFWMSFAKSKPEVYKASKLLPYNLGPDVLGVFNNYILLSREDWPQDEVLLVESHSLTEWDQTRPKRLRMPVP